MEPGSVVSPRQLPILDLAIILIYLMGTTAFGVWFARRGRSLAGYVQGDRSLPWWALGVSVLATYLSSITFLADPGKSYATDWRPFVFSLTLVPACWISVKWFIPLYRRRIQTTAYEHLEQRFGFWARAYAGVSLILLQIGRVAVVLYLLALALSGLLDWEIHWIILALGLITLFYTALGGFAAVVWTDVVQAILLLAAALASVVVLWTSIPGGTETIWQIASRDHKFAFGNMAPSLVQDSALVIFLFGITENLRNFGIDQNYVQRILSARSDRAANKVLWLGGLIYMPISALFFLLGTLLYVYYASVPNAALPDKADQVFPFFIITTMPAGLVGLVIAGLLAAGMSTLSSCLNSSATVWVIDIYQRLCRHPRNEQQLLWLTRVATLVIGCIGIGASLAMLEVRTVLDAWWAISAVFGGAMLGLFILGLIVPTATSGNALVAVCLGILVIAWGTVSKYLGATSGTLVFPLHTLLIGFAGTLTVVLSGWLLSFTNSRRSPVDPLQNS